MTLHNTGRSQGFDCDDVLEGHADYMDGLLAPSAAAQMRAHLDTCASCARFDRIVRKGVSMVRDLPEIEPSEDFEARLQHRIFHIQDEATLAPRTSGVAATFAVAATIALLAWSPVLVKNGRAPQRPTFAGATLPAAAPTYAPTFVRVSVREPVRRNTRTWYTTAASAQLATLPGPYSPLVVEPPVRRGVRQVSSEYRPLD